MKLIISFVGIDGFEKNVFNKIVKQLKNLDFISEVNDFNNQVVLKLSKSVKVSEIKKIIEKVVTQKNVKVFQSSKVIEIARVHKLKHDLTNYDVFIRIEFQYN